MYFNYERVPMKRIHIHWTAGAYFPNSVDLQHYHFLTDGEGKHHQGIPRVSANAGSLKSGYAAHTLNANTDAIGTSMCSMGNAVESPFNPGRWPLLELQFEAHMELVAEISEVYDIDPVPDEILTHAEVQPTLGIRQNNKWDLTRLPFKPELRGHKAVGDYIRQRVSFYRGKAQVPANPTRPPIPVGAIGQVKTNGGNLSLRSQPTLNSVIVGPIPNGTRLEILMDAGEWYQVKTPFGATGYVSADFVELIDGPPATNPTKPHPLRPAIEEMRRLLEEQAKALDNLESQL